MLFTWIPFRCVVSQDPPKDGIRLQIDPYLYHRHLYHCRNFICRYRVQISCFTFDFKRWPTLCACSTSRLSIVLQEVGNIYRFDLDTLKTWIHSHYILNTLFVNIFFPFALLPVDINYQRIYFISFMLLFPQVKRIKLEPYEPKIQQASAIADVGMVILQDYSYSNVANNCAKNHRFETFWLVKWIRDQRADCVATALYRWMVSGRHATTCSAVMGSCDPRTFTAYERNSFLKRSPNSEMPLKN